MAGQPKAPFYLAVLLVIGGLIAFAVYRADIFAPEAEKPQDVRIVLPNAGAEAPDEAAVTTVKEYTLSRRSGCRR
jgi:hypothetical protein